MCNVVSQPPHHIIKCSNLEKCWYDDYLAIPGLILLPYVVGVAVWLGEPFSVEVGYFRCTIGESRIP